MRFHEITAETIGDTWEERAAATQRHETKRVKANAKLRAVQTRAADQARTAATQRARAHDRVRDAQRELAAVKPTGTTSAKSPTPTQ